ncbi:aggregation-promoting factor C-terminal-like domain-containing protein [Nocardiopsis kunsanensis]|uniref:aggregation-promoting factor C-terminal-like domain-containing protein n=1 Tax=Nocardiopsis kunsanensis TaxID=141693 RepID=UPI00034D0256|nr:hypothetical protein [Nocardiopsis kunsanensis]
MPPNPFTPRRLSAIGAAAVVAVSTLSAGSLARTGDVGPGAASTAAVPPAAGADEDFFAPSPGAGGDEQGAEREQKRPEAEQTTEESARTTDGQGGAAHEPEPEPEGENGGGDEEPSPAESPAPESGTQGPSTGEADPGPGPQGPSSTESPEPSPPSGGSGPAPEPDGPARETALEMVLDQGWGADEFHDCLEPLWEKESNWNHTAENSSTGAYGIPQSLPGDKMASHGEDWRTDPATQISWGLSYIKDRHGSPCEAWRHSQANNWY